MKRNSPLKTFIWFLIALAVVAGAVSQCGAQTPVQQDTSNIPTILHYECMYVTQPNGDTHKEFISPHVMYASHNGKIAIVQGVNTLFIWDVYQIVQDGDIVLQFTCQDGVLATFYKKSKRWTFDNVPVQGKRIALQMGPDGVRRL